MLQIDEDNRQLFIVSLDTSEHVHISSRVQKTDEQKLTRADWQTTGPPAELDMVMAVRRAQNIVKDLGSDTKVIFPSDHFPVNIRLKIKLAKSKKRKNKATALWKSPKQTCVENADGCNKELSKQ